MKKRFLAAFLALILMLALTACGASLNSSTYDTGTAGEAEYYSYTGSGGFADSGYTSTDTTDNSGASADVSEYSDKIIYSADATIETREFDKTVEGVYALVQSYGGFVESSYVSGGSYGSSGSRRSASFTIRIPSEHFSEVSDSLSTLGNVPHLRTYTENVTASYYDTQSRLEAYETQEARLVEMLAVADTVEDMLLIQEQLTEVQYEIDSLETTLRIYDRQVAYSTFSLDMDEVVEYTPDPTDSLTYWQKMGSGFMESLASVGDFFTGLFLWLVSNLPVLLLIAAFAAVIILVTKRLRARRGADGLNARERHAKRREERGKRRDERRDAHAQRRASRRGGGGSSGEA